MSKKVLSLAEIIERKKQSNDDRLKVKYYYSETLGTEIEIRKMPLQKYMELSDGVEDDTIKSLNAMIYESCPLFKENTKEAMEYYGVAEPIDLPSAVLEDQLNELNDIGTIINSFYGAEKIADTVKN